MDSIITEVMNNQFHVILSVTFDQFYNHYIDNDMKMSEEFKKFMKNKIAIYKNSFEKSEKNLVNNSQ
jgi:hypothetical protein